MIENRGARKRDKVGRFVDRNYPQPMTWARAARLSRPPEPDDKQTQSKASVMRADLLLTRHPKASPPRRPRPANPSRKAPSRRRTPDCSARAGALPLAKGGIGRPSSSSPSSYYTRPSGLDNLVNKMLGLPPVRVRERRGGSDAATFVRSMRPEPAFERMRPLSDMPQSQELGSRGARSPPRT